MQLRLCFLTIFLSCATAASLWAQEKFQSAEHISLDKPVAHDLYLAAEKIMINANVYGDLRAVAGDIEVRDSIGGDLSVAGGTVDIAGAVMDDLLAVGGDVNVRNSVAGDLIVMGGNVHIGREVSIGQDLLVFSGEVTMEGKVAGEVRVWGGDIRLLGETSGAVYANGGDILLGGSMRGPVQLSAESMALEPGTQIYGDLRYWLPENEMVPDFEQVMVNGRAQYDAELSHREDPRWLGIALPWVTLAIAYFLSALLMLTFLILLFQKPLTQASRKLREDFMGSFGYGVLYLLGTPMLIGLLLFTLVGIPLGLLFLFAYGFSVVFGHLIAAAIFTITLNEQYKYSWGRGKMILIGLLVFATIRGLTLTPVLGFFLSVLLVGACFGAIIMTIVRRRNTVAA